MSKPFPHVPAGGSPPVETSQSRPLGEAAYVRLERMIVMLELAPGAVLSETTLARNLQIGRSPVRDALKRLEREGLVTVLSRRGVIVTGIDAAEHLKLLEVRRVLEMLVARAASRRATPEQRSRLREVADEIEDAAARGDGAYFMHETWDFHGIPVEAAANDAIGSAISLFHGRSRRFWFAHFARCANLEDAARVHARRLRAIADGEPARAEQATAAVMDYLEDFARSTIDPGPRDG